MNSNEPRVLLGNRIYRATGWKRRDKIVLEGRNIGYIHLTDKDRKGVTVAKATNRQLPGRQLSWCAEEAQAQNNRKMTDEKQE